MEKNKKMNWFKDMILDERGHISSKRFIGIISAFVIWVSMLISLFTKNDFKVDGLLAEIVALLAFGSLGLSTVDKFSLRKKTENNNEDGDEG